MLDNGDKHHPVEKLKSVMLATKVTVARMQEAPVARMKDDSEIQRTKDVEMANGNHTFSPGFLESR